MAKAESSKTEDKGRMWKLVWQLKIKSKLNHFMWRRVHDWLVTREALKEKGMEVDNKCRRCGLATETREHLLFHCPKSILIWKLAPLNWDGMQGLSSSFEDWWKSPSLTQKDTQLMEKN